MYLHKSMGDLMAFEFSWVTVTMIRPAQISVMVLTFAEYVSVVFFEDGCGPPLMSYRVQIAATVLCEFC